MFKFLVTTLSQASEFFGCFIEHLSPAESSFAPCPQPPSCNGSQPRLISIQEFENLQGKVCVSGETGTMLTLSQPVRDTEREEQLKIQIGGVVCKRFERYMISKSDLERRQEEIDNDPSRKGLDEARVDISCP